MIYPYLDHVEQVVILGAGWDTRAYRLILHEGVSVYKIDEAEIQTQKRASLKKSKIDSSDVIFTTANLNDESMLDVLKRTDFDLDKPGFILMEGVSYYLEGETAKAILQTVATSLARGSAIAFDYVGKHITEGDTFQLNRSVVPVSRLIRDQWKFGISTEAPAEERLTAFLAQNGLVLLEFEPIGKVDKQQRLKGGLALAVNN